MEEGGNWKSRERETGREREREQERERKRERERHERAAIATVYFTLLQTTKLRQATAW